MDILRAFIQQKVGAKESKEIVRYLPAIIVLSTVTTLTYFYYNAFSPVLSLMASEFGFSEVEQDYYLGSRLNTIFFCIGCPFSLIFSFIADSNSRRSMFFVISLACHLSSFIFSCFKSYTILCIWRGVSGALVTSSLPIFLSILGDIFPSSQRSTASVVSSIVVGLGQLMGQTLSGFIGSKFGWRSFFQLTSTLGLLSILCLKFVEFPHNGEADGLRIPRPESTDKLKSESTNVMQINE